jgi:cysteine desulfurase
LNLGFSAQICGSQNEGLRGGTENLPGISGALEAMHVTFRDRNRKNIRLAKMKDRILKHLQKHFPQEDFRKFAGKHPQFKGFSHDWSFMIVGENTAPNVLLLSFNKNLSGPHFCNVMLKKELLKRNVICSIGSACSTSKKSASHVLHAMKAPFIVRCGVIRVSLGDYNTLRECDDFCKILIKCIHMQD